jgi:hypothetical protein
LSYIAHPVGRTNFAHALHTQAASAGANLITTTVEGQHPPHEDLLTKAGLSARKYGKDQHCAIHRQHKNDHAQKEKQNFRSLPSPYLGLGSFLRIPLFHKDFLFLSFNLFSFSFSYEGRWSSGSRSLDLAIFFWAGWLTELVDQIVIQ